jgi:mRNA interferase MazF
MNPLPGEIWLADLGLAAKTRPVVIVSRQDPDPPRSLVLYVPLTTQRRNSPYEVPLPRLPFLDRESVANVQGLGSLPTVRLERKIGRLEASRVREGPEPDSPVSAFAVISQAFQRYTSFRSPIFSITTSLLRSSIV